NEMKTFLAVFLGSPVAMDAWKSMPETERKEKERAGMQAWMKWMTDHKERIVSNGGAPLGKTKCVDQKGVSDVRNEKVSFTLVRRDSHEADDRMFENHPHFTIFPGERIEVMECVPIPQM